jgi:hypothetical protein
MEVRPQLTWTFCDAENSFRPAGSPDARKIRSAQGCGKAKFFSRSGFFEAASIFLKTAKDALIRAG